MVKKKGTILLVDDEPNIVRAIAFLMQREGFMIETAINGKQALQKAANICPDIILLDVMMPEMDGFSVAETLRRDPSYSNIPIVFLTAKGTKADYQRGYNSGGEIYLTKPFDNQELIDIISELYELG